MTEDHESIQPRVHGERPVDGQDRPRPASVSLDQAADLLGKSRRTVYNMIRDGRLQTMRTINGSQRVLRASLPGTAA